MTSAAKLEIPAEPKPMPVTEWVAFYAIPGSVIGTVVEIIRPEKAIPIPLIIYWVLAAVTGLMLTTRYKQYFEDGVLTLTVKLLIAPEIRYRRRSLAGASGVRVHTRECLGTMFGIYRIERTEIITPHGVVQLAASSDAEREARRVAAYLEVDSLRPRFEPVYARPLLRHPRFCCGLLVLLAMANAPWFFMLIPPGKDSVDHNVYGNYVQAGQLMCAIWAMVAGVLFIIGAWFYYSSGFLAFACATWSFVVCAMTPSSAVHYFLIHAFENSISVPAKFVRCIGQLSYTDSLTGGSASAPGIAIRRSRLLLLVHYETPSQSGYVELVTPGDIPDLETLRQEDRPINILVSRKYPYLAVLYLWRARVQSRWPHPALPWFALTLSGVLSGVVAMRDSSRRHAEYTAAERLAAASPKA